MTDRDKSVGPSHPTETKPSTLIRKAVEDGVPHGTGGYYEDGKYCALGAMAHSLGWRGYEVNDQEGRIDRSRDVEDYLEAHGLPVNQWIGTGEEDEDGILVRITLWSYVVGLNDSEGLPLPEIAERLEGIGL